MERGGGGDSFSATAVSYICIVLHIVHLPHPLWWGISEATRYNTFFFLGHHPSCWTNQWKKSVFSCLYLTPFYLNPPSPHHYLSYIPFFPKCFFPCAFQNSGILKVSLALNASRETSPLVRQDFWYLNNWHKNFRNLRIFENF